MQYVWYLNRENAGQKSLIEGKDDDYDFNPGCIWVPLIADCKGGQNHCLLVIILTSIFTVLENILTIN